MERQDLVSIFRKAVTFLLYFSSLFAILQCRSISFLVLTVLALSYSDYIRTSIPTTIYYSPQQEGEKRTGVRFVFIPTQVPFPLPLP